MKYVLVTGACGGMGRAVVKALSDNGYFVIALDKNICEASDNVMPIQADITDDDSVAAAFERVRAITDELFAILHFAGVYMLDSLIEMSAEAYDKIFDINVRGVFIVNKMFLPLLKRGGRIVITTSELAPLDPLPFTGIYAVTKGALEKYAYSLRMELQLLGIHVSTLRAGAVDTGMLGVSTAALERFCDKTELYRCNAARFRKIVDTVEARCVPPEKIAKKTVSVLKVRKPRFAYSINRNPLLLLMNMLPKHVQLWVIRQVLK